MPPKFTKPFGNSGYDNSGGKIPTGVHFLVPYFSLTGPNDTCHSHSWTSQCEVHVSEGFRYPSFTGEKRAVAVIIAVCAINTLVSMLHSPDLSIPQT